MKPLIYLSSSYSDGGRITDPEELEESVIKSLGWAERLFQAGFHVIAPLASHWWHNHYPRHHTEWIEYDCALVQRCDVLVAVSDHPTGFSAGQRMEIATANTAHIPVFLWGVFAGQHGLNATLSVDSSVTLLDWHIKMKKAYAKNLTERRSPYGSLL